MHLTAPQSGFDVGDRPANARALAVSVVVPTHGRHASLARCLEAYVDDPAKALQRYDEVRRPHAYRMVRGASENTSRFHNPALAAPDTAEAFVSREWQSQAISDRYDWLFTYQADKVDI